MHLIAKNAFFLLLAAGLAQVAPAQTAAYPNKPVRLMVGANAGGGTDIVARMLAEKFADGLKGNFVVENRPGASNTIAAEVTAKAPADGYTLLVATNTGQAIAPHLLKLKFDALKDLTPVGLVVTVPNVLVVGSQVTANTVQELLSQMRAKPNDFKYASSGVGSTQHIAAEGFNLATNVKSIHVPYKGSAQAHLDLGSGVVQIMFDTTSSAMAQIKAGKLKPLALTTRSRSSELPNVPTLAEAGVAGFEMSTWYALYVTAGTPADIVAKLQLELTRVLKLPDVQTKLKSLGGEPGTSTAEQFSQLNRQEYERFGKLIKDAKISLDGN